MVGGINGKTAYGGQFEVEEDAAKASDDLVLDHLKSGGKFKYRIKLNFRNETKLSKLDKEHRDKISILGEAEQRPSTSFTAKRDYHGIFT